ncbi:MAG: FAD-dependent oxidoreductase [Armatimonadota bacterium]
MSQLKPRFPLHGHLPEATDSTVPEPARDVPVIARCDVAVLGGGMTGVCAAAAAARQGKSVVLVEHYGFLGGMATSSMVLIWHSFYGMDRRTKIMGGVLDELIAGLKEFEGVYNADPEGETLHWVIDSEKCKFVCDDIVLGSGAKLLLHTSLCGVIRDGRRIAAVLVENKSGRGAVVAKTFIDCTGDADLIRFAGGETEVGNAQGGCQAPSLCYRFEGVDPLRVDFSMVQAKLFELTMDYNGGKYPPLLWGVHWPGNPAEFMAAGVRVLDINAADGLDMTRAEIEGRYQLRWFLKEARKLPGWEKLRLVAMGAQIGTRESHRIAAEHQLTREEVLYGERFDDAIGQGTYPVDIHNPSGPGIIFENLDGTRVEVKGDRSQLTSRWDGQAQDAPKRDTLCYQIPYRSLIPRGLDNVLVGGRCMGATHEAAGAIRVMVNCMQTGQAAGIAGALAGDDVREVEVGEMQGRLREMGMPLP